MSLTTGRGPLSGRPAGIFNAALPPDIVYAEPYPRRVRGTTGEQCVVDSERVVLVHRQGQYPAFAFPAGDVRDVPTEPEPMVDGYVRIPWSAVETWYEEDEQLLGHPRNPYHRIDCLRTSRRVRVEVLGVVLADVTARIALYETALDPRLYLDPADVRMDLLVPSATTTYCPYKGFTKYWTARIGDEEVPDVAWVYEDPFPESTPIAGLVCFEPTRVTATHDLPAPAI